MKLIMPLAVVFVLALAACMPIQPNTTPTAPASTPTPGPTSTAESGTTESLAGTSWQLTSFGPSGSETPVLSDSTVTLEFGTNNEVGGNGGCNSYGGNYNVQENQIQLEQVVSTLMACADPSVTDQEQQYLQALTTVERFEVTEESLTLWYDGGNGVLNFTASVSAPALPDATPTASTA